MTIAARVFDSALDILDFVGVRPGKVAQTKNAIAGLARV